MKSDAIQTKEVFLPPWDFKAVSIYGDKWRLQVFYKKQCVNAFSGDSWEEVLERAKAWAAAADLEELEGGK